MANLSEAYNPLVVSECEDLMKEMMVWVMRCDELKKQMDLATGEVREAYSLVYKDYLWKLQGKAGKLFFYLCGRTEMNPFERVREDAASNAAAVNHTG